MTTDTITITEFIAKHGITMKALSAKANPNMSDMGPGARHWMCVLEIGEGSGDAIDVTARHQMPHGTFAGVRDGSRFEMQVPFSQGSAIKEPPTAADVLDCLASDAAGVANAQGFEDWASDYGYDTDSRKAEKIYDTCAAQAEDLREFLGDEAYEELLWNTERQ